MDIACFLMLLLLTGPDVRKIVFALDAADFQPVRFDFILQPHMRHVYVFHLSDSMSVWVAKRYDGDSWRYLAKDLCEDASGSAAEK